MTFEIGSRLSKNEIFKLAQTGRFAKNACYGQRSKPENSYLPLIYDIISSIYVSAFLLNRLRECHLILRVVNNVFSMNLFEIELCFMPFMLKVFGINQKNNCSHKN